MAAVKTRNTATLMTEGSIVKSLLLFALPLIFGNLLQQMYNTADSIIVGNFVGSNALAAVGSSGSPIYLLIGFSQGLAVGAGVVVSQYLGAGDHKETREAVHTALAIAVVMGLLLTVGGVACGRALLVAMNTPAEVLADAVTYIRIYFGGVLFSVVYNMTAGILNAAGNSRRSLVYLAWASVTNIVLDLVCVLVFHWGVAGAAAATVFAQWISGIGLGLYTLARMPGLRVSRSDMRFDRALMTEISHFSLLTCMQQSVMNFGILMVQGLVNSFGPSVMAAFAAAVKIDSFAYMPVQDFGNAFSTFIAQNYGAKKEDRIRAGIKSAVGAAAVFCLLISTLVFLFARPLLLIFIRPEESEILSIGVEYLRIEGAFYCGIGALFLLYGLYRAIQKPGMSLVLTVISLGTRVVLAYTLSAVPAVGVAGIWWSVPIGWFLADLAGLLYYRYYIRKNHGLF